MVLQRLHCASLFSDPGREHSQKAICIFAPIHKANMKSYSPILRDCAQIGIGMLDEERAEGLAEHCARISVAASRNQNKPELTACVGAPFLCCLENEGGDYTNPYDVCVIVSDPRHDWRDGPGVLRP